MAQDDLKPAFYAIIPANVRYDKKISDKAKLLYAEITSLTNKEGYCWASNSYFANLYGVGKNTISKNINDLIKKGYLTTKIIYENKVVIERRLYINIVANNDEGITKNNDRGITKNRDRGITKNREDNNKDINNKDIYSRVVGYLNKNTDSSFKSRTIKTQGLIKARIAEGFTEEEFIKVIDNKVSEWVGTEYEKYLRPETLFGTKFESYLNQKVSTKTSTKNQEVTHAAYKPFEF